MTTVRRVLAPNPSPYTGPGTNTWIVGDGPAVFVIDPGPDLPEHRQAIGRALGASAVGVILVTHSHQDHLEGAGALARERRARVVMHPELGDGDEIRAGALSLVALHTPGHAPDHLSFWLKSDRVLFSGDLILGRGSSVVAWPEGDVKAYLDSLERVAALSPAIIFPGHFDPVMDAPAKVEEYLRHRREREAQVLEALSREPVPAEEVAKLVYAAELARRAEGAALAAAALASVRAHLEKLAQEGRAERLEAGEQIRWRRAGS